MQCPHCNQNTKIPTRAFHNVEAYKKPLATITDCCGKIVILSVRHLFEVAATDIKEDAWGQESYG